MTVFVITGHLGSGKTVLAVRLAQLYMQKGRRVAANITLHLEHLLHRSDRQTVTKLPYIPEARHLEQIGAGYDGDPDDYDESKFGLVILDEAGTWLNSRDWADKTRRGLFQWVTHARKKGWDVALLVQDYEALDAQIRRAVTEIYVDCHRLDRIKVPYLGINLPRIHLAQGRYKGPTGSKTDRWWTRGTDLFKAYRTREAVRMEEIMDEQGIMTDMRASYTLLSAWHLSGRYMPPKATAAQWCHFLRVVLTFLPLEFIVGLAAPRAARPNRTREWLLDELTQLIPGSNPEKAKAVYAIRKAKAQSAIVASPGKALAVQQPSKLVARSLAHYRALRLIQSVTVIE